MAVFTLWLSVAIPVTTKEIQRDHEVETMHRGKQYSRAVQLYFRKFHAYPPNPDALVNTNQIRFLRKKYIDPTTGKVDWKPIRYGQNKTPTAMGFFGQPLAGSASALAGTGPGGSPGGGPSSIINSSASGAPAPAISAASSTSSPSDTGLNGQTFGGAGIIGFTPAPPRQSILIYKKKSKYDEWEFVYDPLTEMRTISSNNGLAGQQPGSNPNGTPSPSPTGPTVNPAPSPDPNATPGPGSGTPSTPPQQ
jgi:hypothetical protein